MAKMTSREKEVLAITLTLFLLSGIWVLATKPTGYRAGVYMALSVIGLFYPIGPKSFKARVQVPTTFWVYLFQTVGSIVFWWCLFVSPIKFFSL
jgi:hypothetical protein